MLTIDRSRVTTAAPAQTKHAIRGGDEIAQLLIGTDEPDEIVDAAGIRLRGDAKQLVHVLMPNEHPTLAAWDNF